MNEVKFGVFGLWRGACFVGIINKYEGDIRLYGLQNQRLAQFYARNLGLQQYDGRLFRQRGLY